jgi:hypothetical protein
MVQRGSSKMTQQKRGSGALSGKGKDNNDKAGKKQHGKGKGWNKSMDSNGGSIRFRKHDSDTGNIASSHLVSCQWP